MGINKKSQTIFSLVFMIIVALVFIALFGAMFLKISIGMAVNSGNLDGVELFIIDNLLAIIIIVFLIAVVVIFSTGQK